MDESTQGLSYLEVNSCSFTLSGAQESEAAIDNLLVTEGQQRSMLSWLNLVNNDINSSGFTGDGGFEHGILVGASAEGAAEEEPSVLSISHAGGATQIEGNDIRGTRSAAMKFLCEVVEHGSSNVQVWNINVNRLVENDGDGLVFDYGVSEAQTGYLRCQTQSNLIAENRNGLMVLNAEDPSGALHLFYDTIAYNRVFGVVVDAPDEYVTAWENSLNVFNCSGAYSSMTGWSPSYVPNWTTNDWTGSSTYYFVDAANGDYHLHASAAARNNGTNSPGGTLATLLTRDLFGGNRIAETTTDLGADEYNP